MTEIDLAAHRALLQYLDTPGGRIAYLDQGPRGGHPVLLVHGMPTSSYLYRHVAAALAARGLRVIAPDLLGFGASDKPKDAAQYGTRTQAERLITLLDRLRLPSATFVAHDLGGPWTFEVAEHHPRRIASLVILNTSAYADVFTPPREARLIGGPFGGIMTAVMGSPMGRPMLTKFFRDFTGPATTLSREAARAHWTPLHEGGTRAFRVFAQHLDDMLAQFARHAAALRTLDVPAAIVWGGDDPVLQADKLVPRFAADLSVAPENIHVLERASHFLQEDRPQDIADLVAGFLTRAHELGVGAA